MLSATPKQYKNSTPARVEFFFLIPLHIHQPPNRLFYLFINFQIPLHQLKPNFSSIHLSTISVLLILYFNGFPSSLYISSSIQLSLHFSIIIHHNLIRSKQQTQVLLPYKLILLRPYFSLFLISFLISLPIITYKDGRLTR